MPTDATLPWAAWTASPAGPVASVPTGAEPAPAPLDWFALIGEPRSYGAPTLGITAPAVGAPPSPRPPERPAPVPAGSPIDPATVEAARSIAAIARAMADAQAAVADAHAAWLRQAMVGPWGSGRG